MVVTWARPLLSRGSGDVKLVVLATSDALPGFVAAFFLFQFNLVAFAGTASFLPDCGRLIFFAHVVARLYLMQRWPQSMTGEKVEDDGQAR